MEAARFNRISPAPLASDPAASAANTGRVNPPARVGQTVTYRGASYTVQRVQGALAWIVESALRANNDGLTAPQRVRMVARKELRA